MGCCFSSISSTATPTIKIIALDGSLKELSAPLLVSCILDSSRSFFLCDSDSLYFDTKIPAMYPKSMLELDHMYFVLPAEKLNYPLSASDMAELAVKASAALARASEKSGRRGRIRVLPVEEMGEDADVDGVERIFNEFSVSEFGKRRNNRFVEPSQPRNRVRLSSIEEGDE